MGTMYLPDKRPVQSVPCERQHARRAPRLEIQEATETEGNFYPLAGHTDTQTLTTPASNPLS